ncbi:MAG: hypothetical protein IPK76_02670 [Lewinellaceae bacterium]|nr:hypothetical protein [Lewinellaceae bacterium]
MTALETTTGEIWNFNRQTAPPAGLTNDVVTSLALDSVGHLWVSTLGGGILRLRNADPVQPWFDAYFNNEAPGGNLVYEFVLCDRGQLWLGVQSGLAVLDTATGAFINHDHRTGCLPKLAR